MNHPNLQNAVFTAAVTNIWGGKAQVLGKGNCPQPQSKTAHAVAIYAV